MTPTQRHLARLCLGLSNGKGHAFRNSAWASAGTDGAAHWQAMIAAGWAVAVPVDSVGQLRFALTPAGAALAVDAGETCHLFTMESTPA